MTIDNNSSPKGVIAWMARNPVAANLFMLVILSAGMLSLPLITKETFPSFPADTFTITVPYPGSSPEEIEEGIVLKVEEAIRDLVGIKEIRSEARENLGVVTVELYPDADLAYVINQAKIRVDGIASFPLDAEEPIVEESLHRSRAMRLTLYGDLGEKQLKQYADGIRDEILTLPGITHVDILGSREYEISIELSENALLQYELDFDTVVAALRNRSRDLPGGSLRTREGSITLRSEGQAHTGADFAKLALVTRPDGTVIRLGDIATVIDGLEEQPILSRMNQLPSVTIQVDRVGDQDVLQITQALRDYIASKQAELPEGLQLVGWSDTSVTLQGRINLLLQSGIQGGLLVIVTLALFLDISLAFWVMIGLPFSMLGAMAAIVALGLPVSINVLSLFAFILVLGILVDDGIVTAESAYSLLVQEKRGVDSIVKGVKRVAVSTVFGAVTTMIAFIPGLFLEEGFARVMNHVSWVVILCLAFSLMETKFILPAHLRHIRVEKPSARSKWFNGLSIVQKRFATWLAEFAATRYRGALTTAVENRYLVLASFLAALIIVLSLLPAGILRFVFFPIVPSDYISVDMQMPQGTAWQLTHEYALRLEDAAIEMDRRYREITGSETGAVRNVFVNSSADTEASLIIDLIPSTERRITSVQMTQWLREEVGELPGIRSISYDSTAGPPSLPLDVELSGNDLDMLRRAASDLKLGMAQIAGVYDLRDTFDGGGPELDIQVSTEGKAQGLGQAELARQVRQAFFGAEVQRVQRGRHEVRVYVRLPADWRDSLEALESLWIRMPDGRKLPFGIVGEVQPRSGFSRINRINSQRVVNVRGSLDKMAVEPEEVNARIASELLPKLMSDYPGVKGRLAGEAEDVQKSGRTLRYGLVAILLMIYAALAIPLRSYTEPLIIMSVIPFGILGAFLGHLLLGKEINMLSVIGMLGLTGVVVNDSLVLVDFINQSLAAGSPWREAVLNSGVQRFRAVILTSLTTFMGLLPIQLEQSIQANFVKPMAISIAFGVLFATAVTLFLVPSLYFVSRDLRKLLPDRPVETAGQVD